MCQFIKDHELDIVGMQEVLHNQFQDLRAGLPEYDGIGVGPVSYTHRDVYKRQVHYSLYLMRLCKAKELRIR